MSTRLRSVFRPTLLVLVAFFATRATAAMIEQPVTLDTPTGAISGTLTRPDGDARTPVVLLIAGSGPTDRNGNQPSIRTDNLRLIAAALADAGFASLRYDKRGIAASAKAATREDDLRFETYADDAAAWVAMLRGDDRFAGVAIVGHSEGSLLGMLAVRRGGVRAFVSVAGPARSAVDVLRTQLRPKLPPALSSRNEAILEALDHGHPVADVPDALASLYRPSVQPYLISWFRYVPADVFATLAVPSLIVQGDRDAQIAVTEAQALQAARPQADLLVVPGMTHALKLLPPGPTGQQLTLLDPALPLAPAFIQGVIAFLSRTMTPTTRTP